MPMKVPYDREGAARLRKAAPSELLLIALDDLRKVERQKKRFVVDMSHWFRPPRKDGEYDPWVGSKNQGKCVVCLAGSVIAGTLAVPTDIETDRLGGEVAPGDVNGPTVQKRLVALDTARSGDIRRYLGDLGRKVPKVFDEPEEETTRWDWWNRKPSPEDYGWVVVPEYEHDAKGFKKGLRTMARRLAKAGL